MFDVGEADGGIFYSMELVDGEDLAALLRRVGRLPSEKVADIGRQLCAGLAAAHAQGVLHRDLKPANVLIDDQGQVRITDFGIAISTDRCRPPPADRHAGLHGAGTARQRHAAVRADRRLRARPGAVRAARRSAGVRPIGDAARRAAAAVDARPERQSAARAGDHAGALARPAQPARVGARDGGEPAGRRRPPRHRASRSPAATPASDAVVDRGGRRSSAVVALALVASSFFVSPGARTLTEQDTIVLADFENTTGDPVFDGALKVALAVALEQSPFLKVFPDDRARETLRLMQRSPDDARHPVDRARDRAARTAEGAARRIDRQPRPQLRALARGGQRRDRRRDGARAGGGGEQGGGADVARHGDVCGCARSSASRWPRSRSSTCRCRARRPRRSTRCTPTRWRCTRAARCRVSKRFRICKRAIELDPDLRDGARAAVGGVRQHRSVGAGAGVFAEGVRAARPGQRARAVLHLVALLSRRDAGLGQGARAGAVLDGDLSAGGVRLQQPRHRADSPRPVRAVGRSRFATRFGLDPRFSPGVLESRRVAARARPARRGPGGSAAGGGAAARASSAPAGCRTSCAFVQGDSKTMERELEGVGRPQRDECGVRLAGAHVGVRRTRDGGARAVPPRHPDVAAGATSRRWRRS